MALIVQKFGGTSVADIDRIQKVAKLVAEEKKQGNQLIVVVSAMSGVTNQLDGYAKQVSDLAKHDELAEYDSILASGEQVTSGLLSLTLQSMGHKSRSLLGWQAGIETDPLHSKSRIKNIDTKLFKEYLDQDYILVVAGFQGVSEHKRITTMGRGGSDTSAVAIAAAVKADRCDIYTDVDGVYTADPRIVKDARKLPEVGYEEVLEMASLGAKVLHTRSVELALKHKVKIQVRSSFESSPGTLIINDEDIMEERLITAVTHAKNEARVTLYGVANKPGICAEIFAPLAEKGINIDMIIQNINLDGSEANVTFTVSDSDLKNSLAIFQQAKEKGEIDYQEIRSDQDVSKVSIVGVGMRTNAGIAQKAFQALADQDINIMAITTSEIKISILIAQKSLEKAIESLHTAFDLAG